MLTPHTTAEAHTTAETYRTTGGTDLLGPPNRRPPDPVPANPDPPDAGAADSAVPEASSASVPSELPPFQRLWRLNLDRLGLTQAIGGVVLGLIALFSSYDHITIAGHRIGLQQQWGILCILASVATVFVDAELASRSRLRAAHERDVERDRADQDRDRAAEARERQAEGFERLDQATLLSGRVQLDPTPTNRARFRFFLTLLEQSRLAGPQP